VKKASLGALIALVMAMSAVPALAHVTVQPNEAVVGSFSRFVVRVPNERPDASTVSVEVKLPPLAYVSFEPKDGWERETEDVTLDEPISAFGQEITETVGSVVWSGGSIAPGEFQEFGFSAKMPDEESTLEFRAIQTYDSGEVVRWNGPADADEPAARLKVLDIGAGEGEGQLSVLARAAAELAAGSEEPAAEPTEEPAAEPDTEATAAEETDDDGTLPLILSIVAAVLAAAALVVALRRPAAPPAS
jgi:periplasmic copper chaperone A